MTLGARIRQARQTAGLSQAELADTLGITRSACSQWESDQGTGPRRARLEALAEALGVSYTWLATGRENAIGESEPAYLNAEQLELLRLFKAMPAKQRRALLDFLRSLKR